MRTQNANLIVHIDKIFFSSAIHDMEDPMPRLSEDRDRENSGSGLLSVSQAELGGSNGVSTVDLSLGFNNSTTSHTPLLNNDADPRDQGRTHRHTEESSQGRGQSPSQGSPQQQQQQQHQHRRSHSGSRSGLGGAQSSSLLRSVSTRSIQGQQQPDARGHITRPSIDTVQTMGGSGSEDSQHALLDVGWGLGAIYGRGGEEGEAGGEAGGDGGGSGSAAGVYGNMGASEGFALSAEELQARGDAPSYSEAVAATGTPGDMEMTAIRTAGGRDVDSDTRVEAGAGGDPSTTTTTTTAQRRRSGFRSFAARLSQFMPSGTSTGVTPPVPVPAIPLNSPPPSSTSASPIQDQDTIRSASPTAAATRHHTRHRTTASGSISTVSTVPATSISTPPSALLAASHSRTHARSTSTLASRPDTPGGTATGTLRAASPNPASASTTSLLSALASRSRSRIALASLFSSNANGSHTTLPRPGSSQSNNNLAAASTTSLTLSISPPLPHTVTRTAFVYPSAGPTTEQMKFISSVENVSRFAVPYGRAAEEAVPGPGGEGEEEPPPFEWGEEGEGEGARGEEGEGASEGTRGEEGEGEGEDERRENEGGHVVNPSTSTSRLAPSSSSDSNSSTGAGAGGVANGNGVPFVSWIV